MPESQPFTFRCPTQGCDRTYRARPEFFGKLMVCQGCQAKIRIPSSHGTGSPPPIPARGSSEGTRRPRETPKASRRSAEMPRKPPPGSEFAEDDLLVPRAFEDADPGYEVVSDFEPLP